VSGNESGQSFVVMLLLVLPVLILALGLAYDLGNVAAGVVIAQNAADLAATEAGKLIDADHFGRWEEVRLRPEALLVAQQVAGDLTGGAFVVDAVSIEERTAVVVEGRVAVRTPFFGVFLDRPTVFADVQGVARAMHGAERERE
jgi:hypothetical protein